MQRLDYIQNIYDAEIELIIHQSSILLQKRSHGLGGEMKTSGTIVENYIKETIKKHIPNGYRVCSGYIATSDNIIDNANLVQHDIIIVDERIPSIYKFQVSDIEIVPAEAVCGVLEIKRTLTRDSIKSATDHLKKTKLILDSYQDGVKSKKSRDNANSPINSIASLAPIYAIIGLRAEKHKLEIDYIEQTFKEDIFNFLDLIWSFSDGFIVNYMKFKEPTSYLPNNASRNLSSKDRHQINFANGNEETHSKAFRMGLSALRIWISNTSGTPLDAKLNLKYFDSLK